jgi:hypothetical protein
VKEHPLDNNEAVVVAKSCKEYVGVLSRIPEALLRL